MSGIQGIKQELGIGDIISKTFDLYRRDFTKYVILFLVVEAIIGVLTTLVQRAIVMPTLVSNPTPQQVLNWAPGFFGALISLVALTAIVTWVFVPVAIGSAVKLASQDIETGRANLETSVRFTVSRLVTIWVVGLIVGLIVFLGFIALIVPGIILAIMFSLVLPVVIIENPGILESLGRSRKLVSGRWLKTLAVIIVFAIIVGVSAAVASLISSPFGDGSTIVSSLLSAFYLPLVPIALTVYFYSNAARVAPPMMAQPTMATAPTAQLGMKFCADCGTQLPSTATFCFKCGAKQPT